MNNRVSDSSFYYSIIMHNFLHGHLICLMGWILQKICINLHSNQRLLIQMFKNFYRPVLYCRTTTILQFFLPHHCLFGHNCSTTDSRFRINISSRHGTELINFFVRGSLHSFRQKSRIAKQLQNNCKTIVKN